MKWFASRLIGAFLAGFPVTCWANLAVFSVTDIQRTGNLVPLRKSNIELVSESFSAKLNAQTAQVSVDYEFLNTADGDVVTVGFPIDLMPSPAEGTSYNLDHWKADGLQDLRIADGTTVVPIERSVEETLPLKSRPELIKDVAVTRRWSIATLHFKARERKSVHIAYVVRCMGVDESFERYIPRKISPRTFLYTFRTASGWGTGRIRKLDIALDLTYLRQNQFPILEMKPKVSDAGGGVLRARFRSIELARVPDLLVSYDSKPALFQDYAERIRLLSSNWHVTMCSPGKVGSNALADGNPGSAWMPEFPSAPGTCIDIKPRNGSYINTIAILNGDQSSAANYSRHARIKKLRIDYNLNGEEGPRHEVVDQIFPDSKFDDRVVRFPIAQAIPLDPSQGFEGIVEDVKLTVLESYPGISDAPLAISEIYVFGTNGKK